MQLIDPMSASSISVEVAARLLGRRHIELDTWTPDPGAGQYLLALADEGSDQLDRMGRRLLAG